MAKRSTVIFAFIATLGLAILVLFFMAAYLARTLSAEILIIEAVIPDAIFGRFWVPFLVFGAGFLTVGVLGLGRQRIKNKRTLFSTLIVIFIPLLVFNLFLSISLATTYPIMESPPERMTITNVLVKSNNPLTISLSAKSFYMAEICFDQAYVKDYNKTTVASIIGKEVEIQNSTSHPSNWPGHPYWTFQYVARLPPASEKTITLDFNTTLPPGDYSLWLHSYRQQTFTILNFAISSAP